MAQPYVGEIRMFGGSFAPAGWMFCSGQLLPISENETLFNLIGTTYGGDGQSTFALPDLRGRVPIHQGNGFTLAESAGTESVTLTTAQIPSHTHVPGASNVGGSDNPAGNFWAFSTTGKPYVAPGGAIVSMNPGTIQAAPVGGSQPHDNMIPFLCISYIISLFGIFPNQ
jgi:microcystin-dependent protein